MAGPGGIKQKWGNAVLSVAAKTCQTCGKGSSELFDSLPGLILYRFIC